MAGDGELEDMDRATVVVGWEEVYVEDGKIVNVEEGKSLYPSFAECVKLGVTDKLTTVCHDLLKSKL